MLSSYAHHITPSQNISIKERHNLTARFTKIQNALLCASDLVSDGAFRTYAVLISHDFQDSATRRYAGFVAMTVEELMCLRGKGRSTLYSHLQELERVGLIAMAPGGIKLFQLAEEGSIVQVTEGRPPGDERVSLKVQNSGQAIKELEEEKNTTNSVQYSEVEEIKTQFITRELSDLSLPVWVAAQFIERYGVEKVYTQIINLRRQQANGIVIRKPLQWLQSALARSYTVYTPPTRTPTADTPTSPPLSRHSSIGHFEEIVTEFGYTETIWIEEPANPTDNSTITFHPATTHEPTTPPNHPDNPAPLTFPRIPQPPKPIPAQAAIDLPSPLPTPAPPQSPSHTLSLLTPTLFTPVFPTLYAVKTPRPDAVLPHTPPALIPCSPPCFSEKQSIGETTAGESWWNSNMDHSRLPRHRASQTSSGETIERLIPIHHA